MIMKTLLLTTTAILMTTSAFAQDCKYQKVVTQKSGEIVTSTTDYNCETKPKVIYKEIEKPIYIYRDSTPVITETIVYSEPTYYQPKNNFVSTIVGTLLNVGKVSVGYKIRHKGRCYANWKTGGKTCY